jgi:uncharacterized membrane protein YhfC
MVSNGALAGMAAAAIISAALPIGAYLAARRRFTLSMRNLFVGAVLFVLFARGLEWVIFVSAPRLAPQLNAWFMTHTPVLALYGAVVSGVVEEAGRFLGLRYLARPSEDPGTAAAYAIGHGGAEAIVVGVLGALGFFLAGLLINAGQLDAALGGHLSKTTLLQIHGLEKATALMTLMGGVERISFFIFQIALTLVVWRAVRRRAWWLLGAAVLAHIALNIPAWLAVTGLLRAPPWLYEGIYLIPALGVLAILVIRLQPERLAAGRTRSLML